MTTPTVGPRTSKTCVTAIGRSTHVTQYKPLLDVSAQQDKIFSRVPIFHQRQCITVLDI